MTSTFTVHDATGYEKLMGRWSQKLAPLFIDFAGVKTGEKILDVGCGTGSLTFALLKAADLDEIMAIDFSPIFVAETIRRSTDARIKVEQGDACALSFENGTFNRALALLVLHFVSDAGKAVAEMRRVVQPGGVVAAAVWDHFGGMPGMRMMVDTVAALSEAGRQFRDRYCFQPMMRPGEMKSTFIEHGLLEVTETQLMIRMDYGDFGDYWSQMAAGERAVRQVCFITRRIGCRANRGGCAQRLSGRSARWASFLCERRLGMPGRRSLSKLQQPTILIGPRMDTSWPVGEQTCGWVRGRASKTLDEDQSDPI